MDGEKTQELNYLSPPPSSAAIDEDVVSHLCLVASIPFSATLVEVVNTSSPVPALIDNGSLKPHTSTDSGYFLRSGKKVITGGLGKDYHPVSRGRGRTSFLAKAQTRARRDLHEGKQLSIEWALRAVQAQKKAWK